MDEGMKAAVAVFNDLAGDGYFAKVVNDLIVVEYKGFGAGEFETVENFRQWAYEGGDSV